MDAEAEKATQCKQMAEEMLATLEWIGCHLSLNKHAEIRRRITEIADRAKSLGEKP